MFPRRNKVAMGMKNRTIWVCVRSRNREASRMSWGGFGLVLFFAELNSGKRARVGEVKN